MLSKFEIDNFRVFSHLEIPRLGRVNLVIGPNNVGKTMLLECLCGLKRIESTWNTSPQARDLARNFSGFVAHGDTYHWDRTGQPANAWTFTDGNLTGAAPLPEAQVKTADLTGNACVDHEDLTALLDNWLWSGPSGGYSIADFDFNGQVNMKDFASLAAGWLGTCD